MVTNVNLRNPALLAKMASTVDNISEGRLIVGLGVGDKMSVREVESYGYRFPPLEERLGRLRETIKVMRTLWSGKPVSVQGKFYTLSNAVCLPKPKQENGPPIWIGGRHHRLVGLAAELADGWNHWGLAAGKVREREKLLLERCSSLHRDPNSITQSWSGTIATETLSSANPTERMRAQVFSEMGGRTDYFIASFPPNADCKAYEGFAEAVRSIS